jgi:hypothetical protein
MSVRIGWGKTKPRPGKNTGAHVALFQYAKIVNRQGRSFVLGLQSYRPADLQVLADKAQVLDLRVVGVLRFTPEVTPDLVDQTLGKVRVTGWVTASPEVRRALAEHGE